MNNNSVRSAVICLEIAVIKELYKNKKIGEAQYMKAIKKLEDEQELLVIDEKLVSSVLDIKV